MAKVILTGEIIEVYKQVVVGENDTPKQEFIIKVPGELDEWTQNKRDDEMWKIEIFGKDQIEKHKMDAFMEGQKGIFRVYIGSKHVVLKDSTSIFPVSVRLASFTMATK